MNSNRISIIRLKKFILSHLSMASLLITMSGFQQNYQRVKSRLKGEGLFNSAFAEPISIRYYEKNEHLFPKELPYFHQSKTGNLINTKHGQR